MEHEKRILNLIILTSEGGGRTKASNHCIKLETNLTLDSIALSLQQL